MKKLALALGFWLSLASASFSQQFTMPPPAGVIVNGFVVVSSCGGQSLTANATPAYGTMDTTGKLCTAASVSASISGFPTIQSTGTPISVTTASTTGTLPTGTVVVASNVGATNGAYCKLGASATTSDQLIPPNSWFAFTVGANTQLSCITSTSTTTVNMVGGSGLPTGSGGGGGGSGGGGAITAALGSYAAGALSAGAFATGAGVDGWDLTQGARADAAWTTGSGSVIALLKAIATAEIVTNRAVNVAQWGGNAITCTITAYGTAPTGNCPGFNVFVTNTNANGQATGPNSSPVVLPAAQVTTDPCSLGTKTNLPISQNGTSSVQLVALSGSTTIYVCSLSLIAAGATTVVLTTGTGTACVTTNTAVIGDTTANIANGLSLAANGGLTLGNGAGTIAKGAASSELCMTLGTSVRMSGNLTYVQQ